MTNDIGRQAEEWVKNNKAKIIDRFASPSEYPKEQAPVSTFMAGSPGAGKTEFSKSLVGQFKDKPVRIDADEIREILPEYDGANAYLFQGAASLAVNKLFDHVIKKGISTLLDGTFAHPQALPNISRSLKHGRQVDIYYLYQDPLVSWEFTKIREATEKRNIPKESFAQQFFESQAKVTEAKETFGDKVNLHVVVKDYNRGLEKLSVNVKRVESYIPKKYNNPSDLLKLLS